MNDAPTVPVSSITLVVGADSLIGSETSRWLALAGCHVIGLGSDCHWLKTIAREVQDVRGEFSFHAGNVADPAWTQHTLTQIYQTHAEINFLVSLGQAFSLTFENFYRQRALAATLESGGRLRHILDLNDVQIGKGPADPLPGVSYHCWYVDPQVAAAHTNLVAMEIVTCLADVQPRPADVRRMSLVADQQIMVAHTLAPVYDAIPQVLGPVAHVYVGDTANGLGIYAGKDFQRGEPILKTTGVTEFTHQTEHSMQIDWHVHLEVDAPVRYINHSCCPNAGIHTCAKTGYPDIVAFHNIRAGQEITLDYAMMEYQHDPRPDPKLEFSLTCRCGQSTCRGRLGYYSELPDALRQEYAGFISDYLTRLPTEHGALQPNACVA